MVGSTFADNYNGISCIGSATNQSVNVTVENNTIVGLGPLENIDCQGIFIREGVGGRIAGNTISGFDRSLAVPTDGERRFFRLVKH